MLIIGSSALSKYCNLDRNPKDLDVIVKSYNDIENILLAINSKFIFRFKKLSENKFVVFCFNGPIIEIEIATSQSSIEILNKYKSDNNLVNVFDLYFSVASLNDLYLLKMSHRFLKNSPHFLKTRNDILLMRSLGAHIESETLLKLREKETYYYKHPNLSVKKNEFFGAEFGITYQYDHDSIHESVAHLEKPAYRFYMKDGEEVACDKNKFFSLPIEIQLYGVVEEAQVLALERSQIPYKGKIEPTKSFQIALQKVCTSITSGWFREFAWENYDKVIELSKKDNYTEKFWKDVELGKVKIL